MLCVVRNPWDWYVSWYHWSLQWGGRLEDRSAAKSPEKQAIWEGALRFGEAGFREALTTACSGEFDHPLAPLMRERGIDLYSAHVLDIAGEVIDRLDFTALRFERMKKQLNRYLERHGGSRRPCDGRSGAIRRFGRASTVRIRTITTLISNGSSARGPAGFAGGSTTGSGRSESLPAGRLGPAT